MQSVFLNNTQKNENGWKVREIFLFLFFKIDYLFLWCHTYQSKTKEDRSFGGTRVTCVYCLEQVTDREHAEKSVYINLTTEHTDISYHKKFKDYKEQVTYSQKFCGTNTVKKQKI